MLKRTHHSCSTLKALSAEGLSKKIAYIQDNCILKIVLNLCNSCSFKVWEVNKIILCYFGF